MKEIKTITTPRGHELQYYLNSEGCVCMVNPQTINRYCEIRHRRDNDSLPGIFFAFSVKQFEEGRAELIKSGQLSEGETIYRGPAGMYGTKKGFDLYLMDAEKAEKTVASECDPQEVYFYEYNNYECMISWDGDKDAIKIVKDYWGEQVVASIARLSCF